MPCCIYMAGDPDPFRCQEAADVVLQRVEAAAAPTDFIHFTLTLMARDDESRTAYVRAGTVVAVMPIHPREVEHDLDDPPSWY